MGMSSLTLSDYEISKLKKFISENKLNTKSITNEYELLRVKDDKITLILYESGKLVYNDNYDTMEVLNSILQREKVYDYVLGSDETGKGEWYGPLVVVATALKPEEIIELRLLGVKDSKTIKTSKIIELAKKMLKMDFKRFSLVLNPPKYNDLYATFQSEGKSLNDIMAWAHTRIIKDLLAEIEFKKAQVVIDRFDYQKTEYRMRTLDQTGLEIIQKIGGESEIPVAAASIIAKYLFETEIDKLDEKFGLDLRNTKPEDVKPEILPEVAKIHFKNVNKVLHG